MGFWGVQAFRLPAKFTTGVAPGTTEALKGAPHMAAAATLVAEAVGLGLAEGLGVLV